MKNSLDPKVWRTIGVVIIAPFMTQMDSTIVNVSLSVITQDLHSTISEAQWMISGYLLALALMLPLSGWLVDRFGVKRLYLSCFTLFTLASVLCGSSHSMQGLIAARVIQGMAGGLLTPLTQLMMARVAGKQMARVFGYASVPVLLAPLLGPLIAGMILKVAHWSWLFYVNLPLGILGVVLAAYFIPHDQNLIQKRSFDLMGFFLISPALVCLLYGLSQTSHQESLRILAPGLILLGFFIWHAKQKKSSALIDLELFRNPIFLAAVTTQFFSNGIIYAGQFLIPLYLITGCGLSAEKTGWVLAAMGGGLMCVFPMMGNLTDRFGCRAVVKGGVLLNSLGTLPFLWMVFNGFSMPLVIAALLARGLGQGATGIPTLSAAYSSISQTKLSAATTAMNIVQRLGAPTLTTVMAVVLARSEKIPLTSTVHGFFIPFLALILLQLLVLGAAFGLPLRINSNRETNN